MGRKFVSSPHIERAKKEQSNRNIFILHTKQTIKSIKLTESEIIQGCLRGEAFAQKALVDTFAGYLYTVSRRYMPDEQSARDILQEAYIKIFTHMNQFRSESGKLKNWMSRIVANEALRRRKKYLDYSQSGDPEAMVIKVKPKALGNLMEEDLLEIIKDLPEMYRTVFNLYVLEGYSHKEIGAMLNISDSTSRSNLARAKAILRKRINELENFTQWEKIDSNIL